MVWEEKNKDFFKVMSSHFILIFGNKQYCIVPFFYTYIYALLLIYLKNFFSTSSYAFLQSSFIII